MVNKQKILIVDDDNHIAELIALYLTKECFETSIVNDGEEALTAWQQFSPNLILLDLMLPGMSGEEVLAGIKAADRSIAVLVASAKDDVTSRISLLRAGADDYLTKPFDTGELLARLEAVLRRSKKQTDTDAAERIPISMQYKDLTMYPDHFTVFVGGQELPLTKREYLILELFMEHPGKVFTKSNIYESVWNEEFVGEDNAVNVHISNIRQKLAKLHPNESYIQTVWGIGFKLA